MTAQIQLGKVYLIEHCNRQPNKKYKNNLSKISNFTICQPHKNTTVEYLNPPALKYICGIKFIQEKIALTLKTPNRQESSINCGLMLGSLDTVEGGPALTL